MRAPDQNFLKVVKRPRETESKQRFNSVYSHKMAGACMQSACKIKGSVTADTCLAWLCPALMNSPAWRGWCRASWRCSGSWWAWAAEMMWPSCTRPMWPAPLCCACPAGRDYRMQDHHCGLPDFGANIQQSESSTCKVALLAAQNISEPFLDTMALIREEPESPPLLLCRFWTWAAGGRKCDWRPVRACIATSAARPRTRMPHLNHLIWSGCPCVRPCCRVSMWSGCHCVSLLMTVWVCQTLWSGCHCVPLLIRASVCLTLSQDIRP